MKIYKWLNDPFSAILALAIVEINEGEVADIDKMFRLLDGGTSGFFGVEAKLLTTTTPPLLKRDKRGHLEGQEQFGFPPYDQMMNSKRYYRVHVSRD